MIEQILTNALEPPKPIDLSICPLVRINLYSVQEQIISLTNDPKTTRAIIQKQFKLGSWNLLHTVKGECPLSPLPRQPAKNTANWWRCFLMSGLGFYRCWMIIFLVRHIIHAQRG